MELELLVSGRSNREKLADMLERLALFNGFSHYEASNIAAYMMAYKVRKGVTLFREGGKDDAMWFLVEGKVDIVKETDNDKRCRITTVTAGKSIGEMSVIDGMPYSATGITAEESILVRLTRQSLDSICEELPGVGVKLIKQLARLLSMRLRQTSGVLVQMAGK